ncbi:uncharacterized protein TrAtP1_002272 [Trichoderma atroviride]|uniref:uncharacterized protein n=1 Tax=Hypocrea atroviridis TaxID=63577 RepID=UPI003328A6F7|nr:hypothetical protein TrAtP1_002272 [Trichoderma atroviride]
MDLKESVSKLARRVKAPRSEIVRSEIETRTIEYPRTVEERDELHRRFIVQIEGGYFWLTKAIFGDYITGEDRRNFEPLFDRFKKSKKLRWLWGETKEEWKMDLKEAWNEFWEEGGGKKWIEYNEGLAFLPVLRDIKPCY